VRGVTRARACDSGNIVTEAKVKGSERRSSSSDTRLNWIPVNLYFFLRFFRFFRFFLFFSSLLHAA
jgi:hypothetical protein